MKNKYKTAFAALAMLLLCAGAGNAAASAADSSATSAAPAGRAAVNMEKDDAAKISLFVLLYPGEKRAFVGSESISLDIAPEVVGDKLYVPAKWLVEQLGSKVEWAAQEQTVKMTTPKAFLEFDLAGKKMFVNGKEDDFAKAALLQNERLLVDADWLSSFISYKLNYNEGLKRYELLYIKSGSVSNGFYNDAMPNARPVAKFATSKDTYRIGEPIQYVDLSYDPDMDNLTADWTGRADAIFEPGDFKISLAVTDSHGNVSDTFSKVITITDELYLSHFDYQIYYEPVGTFVKYDEPTLRKYLRGIPSLPNVVKHPKDRPLIVSDSPETFTQKGFLYQERVNGKARLYADHVNGMNEKVQFGIIVRNPSPDKTVTIKTTNQGEVFPSIYANLIGNEASVEFLENDKQPQTMAVGPMQTVYYKKMPDFYPGQGMNVMYDVETDGEVYFSFVAMDAGADLTNVGQYRQLEYTGNVRGTFGWSDVEWTVDAKSFTKPSSLTIGDGTSDPFVTGTDFFMKKDALNLGNYGVVYKIHIPEPRKMSVLLLPRGGVFKGPFKVNGKMVLAPASGVMSDYEGYTILARTTGAEKSLDIEFTPAAGSAFPVDLIFYPLDDK
ncbi:copper amine oxidase N-terminal domain-containing protein [Paenibacillus hamazuiensis]|uniref:copper amine oxidase N-terminal domain-containing protein n=1 Tax=Paenibacillus hamazuiensis TaxID=2936508 RepID=UPI00200DD2E2|nr:copper amine oxidase N-terminal domain-containing protein [Paenibacillus hamazuiensis]